MAESSKRKSFPYLFSHYVLDVTIACYRSVEDLWVHFPMDLSPLLALYMG